MSSPGLHFFVKVEVANRGLLSCRLLPFRDGLFLLIFEGLLLLLLSQPLLLLSLELSLENLLLGQLWLLFPVARARSRRGAAHRPSFGLLFLFEPLALLVVVALGGLAELGRLLLFPWRSRRPAAAIRRLTLLTHNHGRPELLVILADG